MLCNQHHIDFSAASAFGQFDSRIAELVNGQTSVFERLRKSEHNYDWVMLMLMMMGLMGVRNSRRRRDRNIVNMIASTLVLRVCHFRVCTCFIFFCGLRGIFFFRAVNP